MSHQKVEEYKAQESQSIEEQVAELRRRLESEANDRVVNRLNQEIGEARQRAEQAQREVQELEAARQELTVVQG